jgi:hypothetical protein
LTRVIETFENTMEKHGGLFEALLKPSPSWLYSQTTLLTSTTNTSQFIIPTVTLAATRLSLLTSVLPTFSEITSALSESMTTSRSSPSSSLVVSITRLSLAISEHINTTSTSTLDARVVASLLVAISLCQDDITPSLVRAGANDSLMVASTSHLRTGSLSPLPTSTSSALNNNSTTSAVLSPSSTTALSHYKDDQRSTFITIELPDAIKAIDAVFAKQRQEPKTLSVIATSELVFNLFSSRRNVSGVSKQSIVIGGLIRGTEEGVGRRDGGIKSSNTSIVIESSSSNVIIEDCQDTAIFVTVSVTMLCLRRLKRCTIVCVPSSIVFNVEDCSNCTVSGCARSVTVKNCTELKLFTLMNRLCSHRESNTKDESIYIPVFGDSHDVVVGPYNVCAPGIISSTSLSFWGSSGTADVKGQYDTSSSSSFSSSSSSSSSSPSSSSSLPTRPMQRHEYYVRYLPIAADVTSKTVHSDSKGGHASINSNSNEEGKTTETSNMERIDPERFFENEKTSFVGTTEQGEEQERLQIENDLASLDIVTAQRAELLLQSSFVTWLLEDNKASGLKNSLR